jgi:uncharacterized membrane protein
MAKAAGSPDKGSGRKTGGRGPDILATIFAGSAVLHAVVPKYYEMIIPPAIPKKREIVYATGVAEAVAAFGIRRRWSWAGTLGAAILVGVFPANVQMAVDAGSKKLPGLADNKQVAYGRLPLQLPMIWWAWKVRRGR